MAEVTDQAPEDGLAEQPLTTQAREVRPRRQGRLLAALALLLSFASLASACYLYFDLIYLDPDEPLTRDLAVVMTGQAELKRRLLEQDEQWRRQLDAASAQFAERLQAVEASLAERLNQANRAQPHPERDWKLAEVEYLLRAANHQLLMQQDVATALDLLRNADAVVRLLDDMSLHGVRSALGNEILSLEQVGGVDVQGLYLRLNALKRGLSAAALAAPERRLPAAAEQAEDAGGGILSALAQEFRSLVQFRRIDAEVRPLMAPKEGAYLELNLRLMLEQAQLALLKRDQEVFESSLDSAHEWASAYLDADDPATQGAIRALAELRQVRLNRPRPDISASLVELAKVRQGGR